MNFNAFNNRIPFDDRKRCCQMQLSNNRKHYENKPNQCTLNIGWFKHGLPCTYIEEHSLTHQNELHSIISRMRDCDTINSMETSIAHNTHEMAATLTLATTATIDLQSGTFIVNDCTKMETFPTDTMTLLLADWTPLTIMRRTMRWRPSLSSFDCLWSSRVPNGINMFLHYLTIWLLIVIPMSNALSYHESHHHHHHYHHQSLLPPSLLFNKRSVKNGEELVSPMGGYYMKPHQFFNRYFACRFTLKSSIDDVTIDNSHLLLNENNFIDQRNGTLNNRTFTTTTTTAPVSSVSQPLYRHSKRQSRRNKKLKLQCPIDCDGVTRWPETAANSVHYISCMDVRRSVQQIPSTVINYHDVELGMMTQDETISSSSISSIDQTNSEDWTKLDSGERITPIENYMYNEKKLALANASRRCTIDGKWEIQADYTKCGFESAQLFVLSKNQLEKIYDIREKMVNSKFTKLKEAETSFMNCVDTVLSQPPSRLPEPFCERTFDGWTCFNDTPATHVVYFRCPSFVYGFNPQNDAHKTCNNNGKWKVHNETLVPWTNYTSCVDMPDLQFRNLIIKIHIFAYGISLLALLISIAIFFSFKTLSSQTRIRIHKNFFVSFIMNNFMWIIWYFAITDQNILFENGLYCQAVHILLHYFLLCNYFWMFCEGLYLHTILVVAFVSEEKILKWFYLIGWGTPVLIASAYAFFRGNSLDTLNCWVDDSIYSWILKVPVLLSFVLNIIFLVNIIRVLVTKLQAVNSADTHQTRKAVRATLILIPLLGLHFILTPFRPEDRSQFAQIYEIFSALVSSLQGCCVAMLFCFFNGEVLAQIRKRWTQFLLVHGYGSSNHRMSYGGTTVSLFLSPGSKSSVNESSNNNHSISNSVSNENRWSNHNDSLSSVIRSDVCGDENEDDDIDGQPITISMKLVNNNNNNDDNHHNQKDSSGNVTCDYIPLKTINE